MKRWKKIAVLMSIVLLIGEFPSSSDVLVAKATTTQQQITQTQTEKNELESQLGQTNEELEDLKGEQKTLQGELKKLNEQLTAVSNHLEELEGQIKEKEQEIIATQAALDEARATESWQYKCMVIRVRDMYERNDTSYVNALLNVGSFSDMLNVADRFEKIADYDKQKLEEFKENRILIEETEERLKAEKVELDNLKVAAEAEKNKVSGLISQTSNTMAHYADQISDAEQRAREYEAEIKKKEEDLEYLKKKLAEELRMSQAAANATWRDISEVNFAEGDRYLLANLIYCEAGGEPYEGKLAVGAVVINRVLSSVDRKSVV